MNFFRKLVGKISRAGTVLRKALESGIELVFKFAVSLVIVAIIYLIVVVTLSSKYAATLKGTCIEADEFGAKKNVIRAKPISDNDYYLNNPYRHNKFTQKIKQTDLNLALNGDPIAINIVGQWMPWFGDMSETDQKKYNPDSNFFCALEKYTIFDGSEKFRFSNKAEENEFYYIKNYYSGIAALYKENGTTIVEGVEEPPERQKECWITRGAGLYLGVFGLNGRTEPSSYHHVMADKYICSKAHWFGGDAKNDRYVITKYAIDEKNEGNYTLADFKKNYFSVSYYTEAGRQTKSLTEDDKKILEETEHQIIYNIKSHEELLKEEFSGKADNPGYGLIIANSMAKFNQACYRVSRGLNGDKTRSYSAYFRFGPKTLYSNASSFQNVKYTYGEKVKMLIVDKFYKNNQGFYRIEIVSGIEFDDADYLEKKIKEVEFYLLGTPNKKDSSKNRSDGMVARIFNNVLSSKFILFSRALLVLYVVIYGFRIIFGFKKDRNDKSVINRKDLMITLFKFVIIATITSPIAFSFFSETIISFVIDGTIGIIDMIAGTFSNSFSDNTIALTGGLQYANETASLSRNFAIVDEILNFFTDKTLFSKVIAFSFNLDEVFGAGLIISISLLLVLLLYAYKLVQAIIPFIFVLLQFTLVLPLAPLFLLFGLFKETSFILQNWLKFIFSKCLELVGFFTAFYFCTSIIDNFIKKLLNYKVCFKGLGDYIWPDTDEQMGDVGRSWIVELVKKILNEFIAVVTEGLPVSGVNFLSYYLINILITAALVCMFDIITKEVMTLIGSILTIDGATATIGGGKSAMAEGMGGELSFDKQFQSFNETMGFATIQKESDHLFWTKSVLDLGLTEDEKKQGKSLITKNIMNNARTVARFSSNMVSAGSNITIAGAKVVTNGGLGIIKVFGGGLIKFIGSTTGLVTSNKYGSGLKAFGSEAINKAFKKGYFDTGKNVGLAKKRLFEGFSGLAKSLTTAEWKEKDKVQKKDSLFGQDSLIDLETKLSGKFKKPKVSDYRKQKSLSEAVDNLREFVSTNRDEARYASNLLNKKTDFFLKKSLKKMSERKIREIFTKEVANEILSRELEEISDADVSRIRNYLNVYKNNGYNKSGIDYDDTNYNVFSEDYGERFVGKDRQKNILEKGRKSLIDNLNLAYNNKDKLTEFITEASEEVVEEVLGSELTSQLKRLKNPENKRKLTDDEAKQIREKILVNELDIVNSVPEEISKIIKETLTREKGEEIVEKVLGEELLKIIKPKILEQPLKLETEDVNKVKEKILIYRLDMFKNNPEKVSGIIKETLTKESGDKIIEDIIRDRLDKKLELPEEVFTEMRKQDLTNKLDMFKNNPEKVSGIIKETLTKENGDKIIEDIIRDRLDKKLELPEEVFTEMRKQDLTNKLDVTNYKIDGITKAIEGVLKQDNGEEVAKKVLGEELVERIKPKTLEQPLELKPEDVTKVKEKILINKLDMVKDKPEDMAKVVKDLDDDFIREIFKDKNAEQLIKVKNGDLEMTAVEVDNMKEYFKKVEKDGKLSDSIDNDIFSDDFGRDKKYVIADKLSEVNVNNGEFVSLIREQFKEVDESVIKEVFGEANVDLVKNIKDKQDYETTSYDLKTLNDALNDFKENNHEFKIEDKSPDDNEYKVSQGENEYIVKTKTDKDGKSKEVDVSAIFDQDGTVIFEVQGSENIISAGDTKYIISSGEEPEAIINAYKEKNIIVVDKKELLAQKLEVKMAKFQKMMEEAKKYEESQKK